MLCWKMTITSSENNCGIGNFRLLNGLATEACPALFPCKNALPARNRLGLAQDTCLQESRPLARARRKELSLRDLAAKAQRQQQRNKPKKSTKLSVVSQWCESTLLEDRLRAALRVISAVSALRWSKMIFRRFAQSRISFSEKLRNTPSIIFSDLLESALQLQIGSIHKVFRERCLGRKMFKKFAFSENGMK